LLYVSSDDSNSGVVVGTFADGSVRFYNPDTGDDKNPYAPTKIGFSIRGRGGITYYDGSVGNSPPYLVYAVTDDPDIVDSAKT